MDQSYTSSHVPSPPYGASPDRSAPPAGGAAAGANGCGGGGGGEVVGGPVVGGGGGAVVVVGGSSAACTGSPASAANSAAVSPPPDRVGPPPPHDGSATAAKANSPHHRHVRRAPTGRHCGAPSQVLRPRRRSCSRRSRLRTRIAAGVISTSSSSAMNSMPPSRVSARGGVNLMPSSWLWVRMFVFCFSRHAFTTMSSARALSPM